MRQAEVNMLTQGLITLRNQTLAAYAHYQRIPTLQIPVEEEFNPPLWELGHLAWFQEYWITRNQQRDQGVAQDPHHARAPSIIASADCWYDSTQVAHHTRWHLPLLQHDDCLNFLHNTLTQTLCSLAQETNHSPAVYFYWLVLQHEAMHLEASAYMAQALNIPFETPWAPVFQQKAFLTQQANPAFRSLQASEWSLGTDWQTLNHQNFCFDNEVGHRHASLQAFVIALKPVTWLEYLNFVRATDHRLPLYVRQKNLSSSIIACAPMDAYEIQCFGGWLPLDPTASATHISWADAQAYCAWANCRLPTEAEWDMAARTQKDFAWGSVWEWTADDFEPFEGFLPHPYIEYSAPWFGTRKVLRGAARITHPYLRNVHYRNFFTPDRRDIYSGFRVCL